MNFKKTHIHSIGLENFRVFKDKINFDFAPITILTGTNSSGKSSLMRAFYIMSHCFEDGKIKEIIDVEAVLNILGDFSKLPNKKNLKEGNNVISFFLPIVLRGVIDKTTLKIGYSLLNNSINQGKLISVSILSEKEENREIFEIKEDDRKDSKFSNCFNVKLNFQYFAEEYKRESIQIREFRNNMFIRTSNGLITNKYKPNSNEFKNIHPQYYEYEQSMKSKDNKVVLSYRPFFYKYPGFFNEERYEDLYQRLYTYATTDTKFYYPQTNIFRIRPVDLHDPIIKENTIIKNAKIISNKILKNYEFKIGEQKTNSTSKSSSLLCSLPFILLNLDYFIKTSINNFVPRGSTVYKGEGIVMTYNWIDNLDLSYEIKKAFILEIEFNNFVIDRNDFFFECFVDDNIKYSIDESLKQFEQCYFLGNYRNQVQRIYNSKDGSEFQALIKKIKLAEKEEKCIPILRYIKKYLTRFEIGHDYEIVSSGEGQGYFVYIYSKGEKILLADMGYGISQVLPLIFKIISVALEEGDKKKLFIEEPESNLHPALQSKLAELFADAAEDFGIQFVIETHSEYFIRKLQMLTANTYAKNKSGKLPALKTTDTQIYYFNHPDKVEKGQKQVYKINIEEDGALTKNFGKGFYDEASTLNIALYNYTSANKN